MSIQISVKSLLAAAFVVCLAGNQGAMAQATLPNGVGLKPGSIVINPNVKNRPWLVRPASSTSQTGRLHTNVEFLVPQRAYLNVVRPAVGGPPYAGHLVETPASLGCVYKAVAVSNGCDPNVVTTAPAGGTRSIAVVDAFDYSTASSDLKVFVAQFGLSAAVGRIIYGTGAPANGCVNGSKPSSGSGTGWDIEAALDIQYAHAMAPGAKIYLVEANSASYADLFNAVQVAAACVAADGGGQVSMSFGSDEFSGETSYDSVFTNSTVTYFASSGDNPGLEYPCVSPNVVCVGGTTISRSNTTGAFLSETTWNSDHDDVGTGGGPSVYETRPSYQNVIASIVGSARGVPDLALDADPESGVWVYNSTYNGSGQWFQIGGTSLASPAVAGLFNRANHFYASSAVALSSIYTAGGGSNAGTLFTPITSGLCGLPSSSTYPNASNPPYDPANTKATSGLAWNFCAGWGSLKDSGYPNILSAIR